ncbi:hypothetical protein C1H76_2660 [Elsinoe australis]|uniref:Uncharacterized protein n=1 Tax=Elsinoe australis TaxID=40998 RepID=A0A4U7B9X1_9PEZI|nr:hypothetical protein C1H76_2660 [Elsinoe australis]
MTGAIDVDLEDGDEAQDDNEAQGQDEAGTGDEAKAEATVAVTAAKIPLVQTRLFKTTQGIFGINNNFFTNDRCDNDDSPLTDGSSFTKASTPTDGSLFNIDRPATDGSRFNAGSPFNTGSLFNTSSPFTSNSPSTDGSAFTNDSVFTGSSTNDGRHKRAFIIPSCIDSGCAKEYTLESTGSEISGWGREETIDEHDREILDK